MAEPACPQTLAALLREDDLDAAIEAGLMRLDPRTVADGPDRHLLLDTQRKLQRAWAARERYRARMQRLARLAAERETGRRPAAQASASAATASPAAGALPAAALAALARAKARARERGPG